MFVARVVTALCLMTVTACKILVSNSPNRTTSVLIANSSCLSDNVYIYLDVLKTDKIPQVTWYTKKSVCSMERFNNKTDTQYPFDFKGGNTTNPIPWNTSKVSDGDYIMYANVYNISGNISERYREQFSVCNDPTTIKSNSTHFASTTYANELTKCHGNVTDNTETMSPTMLPTMSQTMSPTMSHAKRWTTTHNKSSTSTPIEITTPVPTTIKHSNHTHSNHTHGNHTHSTPTPTSHKMHSTPAPSKHKKKSSTLTPTELKTFAPTTMFHSNHTHSNHTHTHSNHTHTHSNHTHSHTNKTHHNSTSSKKSNRTLINKLYFI